MFAAVLLWLCCAEVALAEASNGCALPEVALQERSVDCLDLWLPAGSQGSSAGFSALNALVDKKLAESDFSKSEQILACAATQIDLSGDSVEKYEIIRRFGILDYKRDKVASALGHFECALGIANARGDRPAIAKQLKNIGSALRRIGDYDAALTALTKSLSILRTLGDTGTGAVLNNIADVYRETNRPQEAEKYYQESLNVLVRDNNIVESMHVYDSLRELAFARGDIDAAEKLLKVALKQLEQVDNRSYRLSVLAGLARAQRLRGNLPAGTAYISDGLEFAQRFELPIPSEFQIEAAHVDRLSGRVENALERLRSSLAIPTLPILERASLQEELAETLEVMGKSTEAIALLRQAHRLELSDARAQNSQRVAWLQERFAATERERTIAKLESENHRRRLWFWLMAVASTAALSFLTILFLRRQHQARLAEAANAARYEEMLARYQRDADALSDDRVSLQALLDSRNEALCLLDAEGVVLAANRAAADRLKINLPQLSGAALAELFEGPDAFALKSAIETMEDTAAQTLQLSATEQRGELTLTLSQFSQGNGVVVLHMSDTVRAVREGAENTAASFQAPAQSEQSSATPVAERSIKSRTDQLSEADSHLEFRSSLVALMLLSVDAWERSTGHNRIEMAERSRIWRVNIDDGRLRARAMERYLNVAKLPQNPRWRDVLRSAYFVLSQCPLEPSTRDKLQQQVDLVLRYTRRNAFGET